MRHFLIVFDRLRGEVLSLKECPDRRGALRARFQAERTYAGRRNIEVVVLGAESEAALHKTHSRYFETTGQLLKTAASHVANR